MPHISDGDLHAWLDGAISEESAEHEAFRVHLESCPECASRLDDARQLRAGADDILASALPRGSAPTFEEIRLRAGDSDEDVSVASTGPGRLRRGWVSAQRLGWAATVVLALGAGWIGRAVLVEKGWTDPFNEGQPTVAGRVAETESEADESRETFFDEVSALEEKDEAGQRSDQPARSNADVRKSDAEGLGGELAPEAPEENEVGFGRPDADAAPDDEAVRLRRTGALAQAEEPQAQAEDRQAGDPALVGEVMAPPAGAARQEARAKSLQPALDPWHAVPTVRLDPTAEAFAACYRLEYSWSPGVAYLPGTIELTAEEAADWAGQSVYTVTYASRTAPGLHEAIWASQAADSIWVRLVSGEDRDAFTVRAGRAGSDWLGEARVLTPDSPVSAGQTRGTVHLLNTRCVPE